MEKGAQLLKIVVTPEGLKLDQVSLLSSKLMGWVEGGWAGHTRRACSATRWGVCSLLGGV